MTSIRPLRSRHVVAGLCLLLMAVPSVAEAQTLVPPGSVWKYLDTGVSLGTGWRSATYDDSGWKAGPAQLGYGDSDEATVVGYGPNPDAKHITTYFRHTFTVTDPAAWSALTLKLIRDDGAIVYLNGVEVLRSNMPAGTVTSTTFAIDALDYPEESTWVVASISASGLVAGTNTVAVEVHQAWYPSSDLSFDLSLSAVGTAEEATITRGPYLQLGSPTGIVLRWRTDRKTASHVEYGPSPDNLPWGASDASLKTEHEVTLTGLHPGTAFYYAVGTGTARLAGGDAAHWFVTPPPTGSAKPTRIWVLGDSGTADASAAAVRNSYRAWSAGRLTDFWLMLGDNAYDSGTNGEFQAAVFDMYPERLRTSVLWPALGNHDVVSSSSASQTGPYFDAFSLPRHGEAGGAASGTEAYYSFDYGNIHVIVLDSADSDPRPAGPMATWLRNDLAQNTLPWIIAVFHHAPYAKGSRDSDYDYEMRQMRENIVPILEQGGVDLVLGGHSHDYERSMLIDGHYEQSAFFTAANVKDGGNGREDGTGIYRKHVGTAHEGTVYAVVGTAGYPNPSGSRNHPAMIVNLVTLGSLVVDIDGLRLDAVFIDAQGARRDSFTISKDPNPAPPTPQPPAAPIGLAAAPPAADSVVLTWIDQATNEDGYDVQRATGTGAYSTVAVLGTSVATFADTGLAAATTYAYRVRAFNGAGQSAWSNTVQVTTPQHAEPGILVPAASVWKYLDTGVDLGTAWRSASYDDTGWKAGAAQLGYGDSDEATVVGYGPNPKAKYVTTYFRRTFTVADPAAWSTLTLKLIRDDGAIVYLNGTEVLRSNMPAGTVTSTTFAIDALDYPEESAWVVASISASGLVAGTNTLAVEVHQAWFESSDLSFDLELRADGSSVTPPAPEPEPEPQPVPTPVAPANLAGQAISSATIALSWLDQASNETAYELARATGTGAFALVATLGPSVSSYTDTGLAAATSYSYRVRAIAQGVASAWSNVATIQTAAQPAAPSALVAVAPTRRTVNLAWADTSDDEQGFQVQRSTNGSTYKSIATVGPNVTAYPVTGLKANTTYYFRVRAYRDGRYSTFSNTAAVKTPR